jgi:hypothetical protein
MDGSHAESPSVKGCFLMKKKTYLIPLVLVVLGLLVPIVYAATHDDQRHEPPSSASVQQSDEEAKAQDGDQNSKQNNQDEDQEPVSLEEKNEQSESTGTTTSNKGSQNQTKKNVISSTEQSGTSTQQTKSSQKETPVTEVKEPQKGIKVGFAVVGKGKKPIKKYNVVISEDSSWGNTALGALAASGEDYVMSTRFSGFVESICGQRNEGSSGWMFVVNGVDPGTGAKDSQVKNGDRVIWYYSESYNAPAPNWNDL